MQVEKAPVTRDTIYDGRPTNCERREGLHTKYSNVGLWIIANELPRAFPFIEKHVRALTFLPFHARSQYISRNARKATFHERVCRGYSSKSWQSLASKIEIFNPPGLLSAPTMAPTKPLADEYCREFWIFDFVNFEQPRSLTLVASPRSLEMMLRTVTIVATFSRISPAKVTRALIT